MSIMILIHTSISQIHMITFIITILTIICLPLTSRTNLNKQMTHISPCP